MQSIPDIQQHLGDSLVVFQLMVEIVDRLNRVFSEEGEFLLINYSISCEAIVEGNPASLAQQRQDPLIVVVIVDFVCINEGEIKGAKVLLVSEQSIETLQSRLQSQVYFLGNLREVPVFPAQISEFLGNVKGEDLAIFREGMCHG